jgi:Fe2+ or Zn2+ uptake regulation protein
LPVAAVTATLGERAVPGRDDFYNECQLTIVVVNWWRHEKRCRAGAVVKTPEELSALFRARGRKVTAQRRCIFRVLHGDVTHPTAEAVHARARAEMETISLKTVYQTLHDLADLGEIAALDLGTGTARFDPNVEGAHHHLVCTCCGKVRDLHADFRDLAVPEGADEGFEVGEAEVVFRGLCASCRPKAGRRRRREAQVSGAGGDH